LRGVDLDVLPFAGVALVQQGDEEGRGRSRSRNDIRDAGAFGSSFPYGRDNDVGSNRAQGLVVEAQSGALRRVTAFDDDVGEGDETVEQRRAGGSREVERAGELVAVELKEGRRPLRWLALDGYDLGAGVSQ